MNRTLYVVLWVLEVLMIVGIVVATVLPVQDLALREYIEWQQHPSPETYTAFLEKRRQENSVRVTIALSCGITAGLLAGPLRKHRKKLR